LGRELAKGGGENQVNGRNAMLRQDGIDNLGVRVPVVKGRALVFTVPQSAAGSQAMADAVYSAPVDGRSMIGRDGT
jgi:hypothetical protein